MKPRRASRFGRVTVLTIFAIVIVAALIVAWTASTLSSQKTSPACSTQRSMHAFGADGHTDGTANPIFVRWKDQFCASRDLGPATGPVRKLGKTLRVQEFKLTAHRAYWNLATGRVWLGTQPAVAAKVFSKHGIKPQWDLPVPAAWLKAFYAGTDWGAALDPVNEGAKPIWQQQVFIGGTGTFASNQVMWRKTQPGSPTPQFYEPQKWQPIGRVAQTFDSAVKHQNAYAAAQYLGTKLAYQAVDSCLQKLLGFNGWPTAFHYAIRLWNGSAAAVKTVYSVGRGQVSERFGLINSHPWKIESISSIRGATAKPSCPAWSPPSNAFPGTYSVGDSVMVDAQSNLQTMGITVDAAVSRQFDTGIAILRQLKSEGRLPPRVVIGLGTNGPMTQSDFDSALQMLSGETRVVVLTVREPRSWQNTVNHVVKTGAKMFKNTRVADFFTASAGHPEWFAPDGVHLQPAGALAYSHVIANALAVR